MPRTRRETSAGKLKRTINDDKGERENAIEENSEAKKEGRSTRKSIKRKGANSVKKTDSKRSKNSTAAQFHEDEQEICMNVEVEDDSEEEGEIPEEDELVSDDPEITFNSQHLENNNASIFVKILTRRILVSMGVILGEQIEIETSLNVKGISQRKDRVSPCPQC